MLKIKSILIDENETNGKPHWKSNVFEFSDLNLIIGPNASGKTQFLRRIDYLRGLHTPDQPTKNISTIFKTSIKFDVISEDGSFLKSIDYNLTISPGPILEEEIKGSDGTLHFTFKDNNALLWDETEKKQKSFLYNNTSTITKQVSHMKEFGTIAQIGKFFQNVLHIQSNNFNQFEVEINMNQIVPSRSMSNISPVILNWKRNFPDIYKQLISKYKSFFDKVQDFETELIPTTNTISSAEILSLSEKDIDRQIKIFDMSSGMVRILALLALSFIRRLPRREAPSLILIDEIDNGLDYERVGSIIDLLKSEADFSQIVVSSHSPVVCNFIDPNDWRVFRRKGSIHKITSPLKIEDTKKLIEDSKKSNWDLYKTHISKSGLYSVD